ncbi:MAG: hypothetical protein DRN04_04460 [Thermoprotei archaeon]|nr:MAG: hypothetical protein DRN04_04460 [Thermoprotei archaeon]
MSGKTEASVTGLREGFTDRVILAMIFSSLIMTPAFGWVLLSTGIGVGPIYAAYVTMVIFGELARLMRSPLSESELATIRWGASAAVGAVTGIAYNVFLRKSPITRQAGIADKIPIYVVPPANSPALIQRTIFHPDWILPITLGYIGLPFSILVLVGLSFLMRQIFIEIEKLPFPTGALAAELAKSLAAEEGESKRYEIFCLSAFIAFLYGTAYYIAPALLMVITGSPVPIQIFPTHIDLTTMFDYTPLFGATLSFTADILAISIGMIIPDAVIYGAVVSYVATMIFGNNILVRLGLYKWKPGTPMMGPGLTGVWMETMLHFWLSISIGITVAAAIVPFVKNIKGVVKGIMSIFSLSKEQESELGIWSAKKCIIVWLIGSLGLCILSYIVDITFYPDDNLPVWLIPTITIGLALVNSLSAGRFAGLMGSGITIPYAQQALLIAFYNGVEGWFLPFLGGPGVTGDPGLICIGFKAAELTRTKPMSIIKAHVIGGIMASISGLFFGYLFWHLYDIPSRILPAPTFYPDAAMLVMFITKKFTYIRPDWLIAGFIFGVVWELVPFLSSVLSTIGLAWGIGALPSSVTSPFIGWIIKEIIRRKKGDEWTRNYLLSIVAGIWAGGSLALALGTGITFAWQAIQPGLY